MNSDNAIIQDLDQTYEAFEKALYILNVYTVDLSKTFGTVDHKSLFKKLELTNAKCNYCNWMKSYLSNRMRMLKQTRLEQVKYFS